MISVDYYLLCEDVRRETGGKVSFLGVYIDNTVRLPPQEFESGALPKVHLFARVTADADFDGRCTLTVTDPRGAPMGQQITLDRMTFRRGNASAVELVLDGMPLAAGAGTYKCELEIAEQTVFFSFDVEAQSELVTTHERVAP